MVFIKRSTVRLDLDGEVVPDWVDHTNKETVKTKAASSNELDVDEEKADAEGE